MKLIDANPIIDKLLERYKADAREYFKQGYNYRVGLSQAIDLLEKAPTVDTWNNHDVACLLADMFGDACACNYNGIDEWLPERCELLDACPNPYGVACWEQFLKHRTEGSKE